MFFFRDRYLLCDEMRMFNSSIANTTQICVSECVIIKSVNQLENIDYQLTVNRNCENGNFTVLTISVHWLLVNQLYLSGLTHSVLGYDIINLGTL